MILDTVKYINKTEQEEVSDCNRGKGGGGEAAAQIGQAGSLKRGHLCWNLSDEM